METASYSQSSASSLIASMSFEGVRVLPELSFLGSVALVASIFILVPPMSTERILMGVHAAAGSLGDAWSGGVVSSGGSDLSVLTSSGSTRRGRGRLDIADTPWEEADN